MVNGKQGWETEVVEEKGKDLGEAKHNSTARVKEILDKKETPNLRSSINDIGAYTTQIFHYKNGIKKTVKNLVSASICESEMLKIMDKNGVMHIINKANLLHTEVHPQ